MENDNDKLLSRKTTNEEIETASFRRGFIVGILFTVAAALFFNSANILYKRYVKHELTRDQKLARIMSTIEKNYVNEYNKEDIEEGIYAGAVAALGDQYSYYMSKGQFENFIENTNGSYTGVGVILGMDNENIKVLYVFEGSPAQVSGIEVGDIIKEVDAKAVDKENYEEMIKNIRNDKIKNTTIKVYRESIGKEMEIKLNKDKIDIPTVSHKMYDNRIGKITISKFEGVTEEQFDNAFKELDEEGMRGLIIDLRDNPGGLLNVVANITDKLVPAGYITYTEDRNGKKDYLYSDEQCFGKPLVILVNGNSASASEVLSGAVKDLGAGKLVGEKTYGKGVVQTIYSMGDGSGMKLTISKYYTPSGVCIDGVGIEPDYEVSFADGVDYKDVDEENDVQLKKAIEVINEMID